MTTLPIILLIVGLAIIAGLAYYAWTLNQKVKQKEQAILDSVNEKHDRIIESIRVITSAVKDDQIELIEASIRLKVLLDNLPLSEQEREPYVVLSVIYDKVAHIPTHENWKALSRKEKFQFEKEMATIKAEYSDLFQDTIETLKTAKLEFTPTIQRN